VLPQIRPETDPWDLAYGCLLKHRQFASDKCNHVLLQTAKQLGQEIAGKEEDSVPHKIAAKGPDREGCWEKESGRWCPGPHGWYLVKPTVSPSEAPSPSPTTKTSQATPTMEAKQETPDASSHSTTSELDEADVADVARYADVADDAQPSAPETPPLQQRIHKFYNAAASRFKRMVKAFKWGEIQDYLLAPTGMLLAGSLMCLFCWFICNCCCRVKKTASLEHTYTVLMNSASSEDQL
jgi:hypothetical protein